MRKFGPKPKDRINLHQPSCPICDRPFKEGDYTTLIPIEPDGPEEEYKMKHGQAYRTVCLEAHWDCVPDSEKVER